jgi:hypothetical protein
VPVPPAPDRPAPGSSKESPAEQERRSSAVSDLSRYGDAVVDLAHSNLQALGPELFAILLVAG